MKKEGTALTRSTHRRAFFENGAATAGAATLGGSLQTWQDKEANALPITDTDIGFPGSTGSGSFADPRPREKRTPSLCMEILCGRI